MEEKKKKDDKENLIVGSLAIALLIVFWIIANFWIGLLLAVAGAVSWIWIEKQVKDKQMAKNIVIGFIVLLVAIPIIVSFISATNSDKEMRENRDKIVEGLGEESDYTTKANSSERKVELNIIKIIGYKTNMDEPRVKKVEFEGSNLTIDFVANENLSTKLTRRGILLDVEDLLKEFPPVILSNTESILFQTFLPLVDAYGKTSISKVMTISITKDVWEKISWENFLNDNLPKVASDYREHPVLNVQ